MRTGRGVALMLIAGALAHGGLRWATRGQRSAAECLDEQGAVLVLDGREVCNLSAHNMFDVTPLRPVWATAGIYLSAVTIGVSALLLGASLLRTGERE